MKTLTNFTIIYKRKLLIFSFLIFTGLTFMAISCEQTEKIGVIYVTHGGYATYKEQYVWDVGVQQFSYDRNHPASAAINNSALWHVPLQHEIVKKYNIKYDIWYNRLGGRDPFAEIGDLQAEGIKNALDQVAHKYNISFELVQATWMAGEDISTYPYPRYMYYPLDGKGDKCTYCGEKEPDGPWEDCDPDRYNVDGPAEKLLKKGVSRIIMIDSTTGCVRFKKTYDVYTLTKKVVDEWNEKYGTSVSLLWVNDYTDLMERSYPTKPEGWTSTLGKPEENPTPPWAANQNPAANDPELAEIHVDGIVNQFSESVLPEDTAVMILNHAIHDYNEYFDPKIDDTLVINKNIKAMLLKMFPDMNPDNIIGAYMGIMEVNPEAEHNEKERTRRMRGENLGHAWLYLSDKELPEDPWGYKYWDALEILKNQGAKHIVICFPQIVTNSALDMLEVPNQVAKEIGYKNWLYWESKNYERYHGVGHPFVEYFGNWVNTNCDGEPCCFTMGGCEDGRTYPPPRQTALNRVRGDFDPSLAYHISEFGHLGYDPELGHPDPNIPVQNQYTGTWAMWDPPNYDSAFTEFLAKIVLDAALGNLE